MPFPGMPNAIVLETKCHSLQFSGYLGPAVRQLQAVWHPGASHRLSETYMTSYHDLQKKFCFLYSLSDVSRKP